MAITQRFGFTKLTGSDTAGYSSINTVIDSIDGIMYSSTPPIGSIVIFDGTNLPTGWTTVTAPTGMPTLNSPYSYIRRSAV